MRWLISILLVAALAVALALAGRYDPGYVVLVYPPWRAELSFITFFLLLVALMTGGYVFARIAIITLNLPAAIRERKALREEDKRRERFVDVVGQFLEGRYQEVEKSAVLLDGEERRDALAQVLAARAAQATRAHAKRDANLQRAQQAAPLAAHLAEAEARMELRDYLAALAAIESGKSIAPAHTALLRLELKARSHLGQWDAVLKLAEQLAKANAIDSPALELTRQAAHCENLKRRAGDAKSLLEYWKKLPGELRTTPRVASDAIASMQQCGLNDEALAALEAVLDKNWDETLAARYGHVIGRDVLKQIERAEKWLLQRPRDGALLMSLAELCAYQQLWGKAQSYAEAALAVAPSVEAHLALAALKEKSGQNSDACAHLKQALAMCRSTKQL